MDPPRDHISSPVVNQKPVVERELEWNESSAVKEEGFGWRVIVKEAVNKSNHPIQNPLLFFTQHKHVTVYLRTFGLLS
jgi:hypothetical protein